MKMRFHKDFFLLLWTVGLLSLSAEAQLSNLQLYQRCYAHLTGMSALTSPILSRIRANEVKAIESCIAHLMSSELRDDGSIDQNNQVGAEVARQIYQIHRSWFKKASVMDSEINRDFHYPTMDVYDVNEPALHLTRATLRPRTNIAEAITRPVSLEAIRIPARPQVRYYLVNPATNAYERRPHPLPRVSQLLNNDPRSDRNVVDFQTNLTGDHFFPVGVPRVQIGRLRGIRDRDQNHIMHTMVLNPNSEGLEILNPGNPPLGFPIFRNHGGGLIGSTPYLLTNFGHGYLYRANGSEKLTRKWSEAVMRDLMCRELPALRNEDAVRFLSSEGAAPQFRKSTQCLTCHATIDQMAMVTRNLMMASSGNRSFDTNIFPNYFVTLASQSPDLGPHPQPWPEVNDVDFFRRVPQGRLYFRNYTGRLVDIPLGSLQELGQAIAQQDDYYICLASRYFEHFTGIKVHLKDPASRSESFYSDRRFRVLLDFVVDLGLDLKQHGSVKQTMSRILRSPFYLNPSYQPFTPSGTLQSTSGGGQ
jgi:hypothetical protein